MILNISYDTKDEPEIVELSGDELAAFLKCDGIGYDGNYYRITSKVFEFVDSKTELTVIAQQDHSVTF